MTTPPRRQTTAAKCARCRKLARALADAEKAGDQSKAVDCRVLIARHPHHDGPRDATDDGTRP
ncbi:hypothetical protein ACH4LN_14020 [Streptomyces albus]|uniref:Uncharacterized protein n=1 Tax=Streptomyces albus TaxID=1888 RepID=A0A8H1QVT8_9ACTN|nr:hypothetical protein [Streptomyces albus]TGG84733.1 hypothetical protein D8771_12920 [Streptomyces albus]UVN56203.1 hypothetical protein NR995_18035 [Streptomyces albus]